MPPLPDTTNWTIEQWAEYFQQELGPDADPAYVDWIKGIVGGKTEETTSRRDQSVGPRDFPEKYKPATTYGRRDTRSGWSRSESHERIRERSRTIGAGTGPNQDDDYDPWSEDAYNFLFGIFAQQPAYQIPQEVFDIMSLSTQTAETLANLYTQQREDVLSRLQGEQATALDLLGLSKYQQLAEADIMEQRMGDVFSQGFQESMATLTGSRAEQLGLAGETGEQMMGAFEGGFTEARGILGKSREEQLGQVDQMGEQMLGAYERGYEESMGTLRGSRAQRLAEAGKTERAMLGEYTREGEAGLDILSQKAYGGLPGEQQYLENLQAGTAAAVSNLTRRGGGGGGALGAMADVYTGQQGEMRGLAAMRAQYQAEGMGELAGARQEYGAGLAGIRGQAGAARLDVMGDVDRQVAAAQERYGAGQADIYGRTGEARVDVMSTMDRQRAGMEERYGAGMADIYGRTGEAQLGIMGSMDQQIAASQEKYGTGMADIFQTGAQTRIGVRSSMDQVTAQARSNMASQYAETSRGATQDIGMAIGQGSQMVTAALGNIADKRETAFNLNFLQPYYDQRKYIIDEMRRTDPTSWYTNFISQMAGATFGSQAQGIAGWATGADMIGNAGNQMLGSYFQTKMMDNWGMFGQGSTNRPIS